ncbi:PKD domain-containing protein [Hymenobacter sp. GOD-10R]|uniref:PKD domain-containing protein n=1 Tax=Hymenobacter sp. GOD-10R TaxID=3093922 RepID=UPI002D774405|nr:PKD domain-containing protein [Hymenobacter sp. GOD-10R]WRQ29574.1 PKD domain-containing protein [Hymenobacter sp. GOD-10R]
MAVAARAQQAGDTISAACPLPRVVDLCVELDASRSADSLSGPLTYRWNMGDGTMLTGLVVSHCYQERKRYTVQLDVVDDRTGEVRPAEKILPVDFTQETVLNFSAPDTVRVGQVITCDAADSQMPLCENVVVLWDFRDGYVTNGRRVQHAFRRPGQYAIRMSLRGNGPDPCPESHCVSRPIVVVQP